MTLIEYRKLVGMTIRDLAKVIGISATTISRVERGHKPHPLIARQIEVMTNRRVKIDRR